MQKDKWRHPFPTLKQENQNVCGSNIELKCLFIGLKLLTSCAENNGMVYCRQVQLWKSLISGEAVTWD